MILLKVCHSIRVLAILTPFDLCSDDETTARDPLRLFRRNVLRQFELKGTIEFRCDSISWGGATQAPPPNQAGAALFSFPPLKKSHLYDFMLIHNQDMMLSELKE